MRNAMATLLRLRALAIVCVSFIFLIPPLLQSSEMPFGPWTDTDDHQGIQFRYQRSDPATDSKRPSCYLQFRDLQPADKKNGLSGKGDTDIDFRYDVLDPEGSDFSNDGSTRIWNQLGNYGNENIDLCKEVKSVVVTKLDRGL